MYLFFHCNMRDKNNRFMLLSPQRCGQIHSSSVSLLGEDQSLGNHAPVLFFRRIQLSSSPKYCFNFSLSHRKEYGILSFDGNLIHGLWMHFFRQLSCSCSTDSDNIFHCVGRDPVNKLYFSPSLFINQQTIVFSLSPPTCIHRMRMHLSRLFSNP